MAPLGDANSMQLLRLFMPNTVALLWLPPYGRRTSNEHVWQEQQCGFTGLQRLQRLPHVLNLRETRNNEQPNSKHAAYDRPHDCRGGNRVPRHIVRHGRTEQKCRNANSDDIRAGYPSESHSCG